MKTLTTLFKNSVFLLFLAAISCAGGKALSTDYVKPPVEAEGTFALIYYGGKNVHDLETVAILDKEEDGYQIKPYSPEFDYKIINNVEAGTAFEKGEGFLQHLNLIHSSETRAIKGPAGEIIGYEIRPLFMSAHFYTTDPLQTTYVLMPDNVVRVYVSHKEQRGPSSGILYKK